MKIHRVFQGLCQRWRIAVRRTSTLALFAMVLDVAGAVGQTPTLLLTQNLRLDGESESFSVIGKVFVSKRGWIALSQAQDGKYVVFDERGKRAASVGRIGDGPGEFRDLANGRAGWMGDSLWIYDPGTRRTTFFGPSGSVIRSILLPLSLVRPVPKDEPAGKRIIFGFTPFAYLQSSDMIGFARFGIRRTSLPSLDTDQGFLLVDSAGSIKRTIASVALANDMYTPSGAGNAISVGIPFAVRTFEDVGSDGTVAEVSMNLGKSNATYRVTVVSPSGDTLFSKEFSVGATTIPSRAVDSAVAAISRMLSQRNTPALVEDLVLGVRSAMPSVYPPVEGIRVGRDHTVWVELRDGGDGRPCVVLDRKGAVVGRLLLPPRTRLAQADRSTVLAIERSGDGIQSLVRFEVRSSR